MRTIFPLCMMCISMTFTMIITSTWTNSCQIYQTNSGFAPNATKKKCMILSINSVASCNRYLGDESVIISASLQRNVSNWSKSTNLISKGNTSQWFFCLLFDHISYPGYLKQCISDCFLVGIPPVFRWLLANCTRLRVLQSQRLSTDSRVACFLISLLTLFVARN